MADHFQIPVEGEVHVWSFCPGDFSAGLTALAGLLSLEERERAERFLRPLDRLRYVLTRGVLRQLLGRYLSMLPAELVFRQTAFGKPSLVLLPKQPRLDFNLSHSGDVVLLIVARNCRVGIDVEAVRDDLDVIDLATARFAPKEIETLKVYEDSDRVGAFFRCWTRKEAYVKARGEGFAVPFDQFAVSFDPDEAPRLQWAADDPRVSERWSVFDVSPGRGYAGAAVVEGRPVALIQRSLPGNL